MASFYGYEYHYILYRLSFAQALTLVEVHNERERKAYEAAEKQANANSRDDGWFDPDEFNTARPENLPSVDDVKAVFSRMLT